MPAPIDDPEIRRGAAEQVALLTGLLRRCPVHGDVYDPGQHDYQGACMTAAFLINRADPRVAAFADDRAALKELLSSVATRYSSSCPRCVGG
jgi:hypothetical protein